MSIVEAKRPWSAHCFSRTLRCAVCGISRAASGIRPGGLPLWAPAVETARNLRRPEPSGNNPSFQAFLRADLERAVSVVVDGRRPI